MVKEEKLPVAEEALREVALCRERVRLRIVVVPLVAPIVRLVAPPRRLKVVLAEEREPPLTAKFPPKVVVLVPRKE